MLATNDLFFIFHFGEFGIHHVTFVLGGLGLSSAFAGLRLGLLGGVHFFAQFLRGAGERFSLGVDGVFIVTLHDFFGFLQCAFDHAFFIRSQLFAVFLQRLLRGMDQRIQLVARANQ